MPLIRSKNSRPRRRRTTVAPGLATIAVTLAAVAACNSTGDSDSNNTAATGSSPDAAAASSCQVGTGKEITLAVWNDTQTLGGTQQPAGVLLLDQAYDLPDTIGDRVAEREAAAGSAWMSGAFPGYPAEGVVSYADGRVGVIAQPDEADSSAELVVLNPNGTVDSEFDARASRLAPDPSAESTASSGYHRVEADGIALPASAAGDETNEYYAIDAVTEGDPGTVWVLLRGSDQIYSGTLYTAGLEDSQPLGQAFDASGCS